MNGSMEPNTTDSGKTVMHMGKESLVILAEMCTKDNGLETELMAKEHIKAKVELSILALGRMTSLMGIQKKPKLIDLYTKDSTRWGLKVGLAIINKAMVMSTMANGETITLKEL